MFALHPLGCVLKPKTLIIPNKFVSIIYFKDLFFCLIVGVWGPKPIRAGACGAAAGSCGLPGMGVGNQPWGSAKAAAVEMAELQPNVIFLNMF